MNFLIEENKAFLILLMNEGVDFIIIGGYAVNFHGYNRTTGDMDIWLKPDNTNKMRLIDALVKNGFERDDLTALNDMDFTAHQAFSIGDVPYKVDFLTKISGVEFDDAWVQKVFLPLKEYQIPVLNLHHLVLSKISNQRLQDKADVAELQKIQARKKSNS